METTVTVCLGTIIGATIGMPSYIPATKQLIEGKLVICAVEGRIRSSLF